MADMEKTVSRATPSEKMGEVINTNNSSEFDEYLGLCEVMMEEKMKKLVRKIE